MVKKIQEMVLDIQVIVEGIFENNFDFQIIEGKFYFNISKNLFV